MKYFPHTCQVALIKKTTSKKCLRRMQRKGNPCAIVGAKCMIAATMEAIEAFLKNWKQELPYGPAVPLLGTFLKNRGNTSHKRYVCSSVHWSIIYSQGAKIRRNPQVPYDRWVKKEEMVCTHTHHTEWNITQQYKKEWNLVIVDNMDGFRVLCQISLTQRKTNTTHFIYMWNIETK